MKYPIFERQPGIFCLATDAPTGEGYLFCGKQPDGLYLFVSREGKREVFARHRSYAGWHLQRGKSVYEFVRCLPP